MNPQLHSTPPNAASVATRPRATIDDVRALPSVHGTAVTRNARPTRAGMRLRMVLPLVAAALAAGACGPGGDAPGGDGSDAAPAAAAPAAPGAQPAAEALPPAPPPGQPDPLAEARDSIQEADLYHRRQRSMESLESCMAKAKGLEPAVRATIETACKRARGEAR
jgi:hypothetical protein